MNMRSKCFIGFWVATVLASGGLLAQKTSNENAAERVGGRAGVAGQKGLSGPGGTVRRSSSNAPSGNQANRWRYKFHNGHWWYYDRGKQWSYWNGSAWRPYDRTTYGQWLNLQAQRRPANTIELIEREKNSPQGGDDGRPANTIGLIEQEMNSPRGGDDGRPRNTIGLIEEEMNSSRDVED